MRESPRTLTLIAILAVELVACGGGGAAVSEAPAVGDAAADAQPAPPLAVPAAPSTPAPGAAPAAPAEAAPTNEATEPAPQTTTPAQAAMPAGAVPMTAAQASRLLSMATFGAPRAEVRALAGTTADAWIARQFELPASYHDPLLDALFAQLEQYPEEAEPAGLLPEYFRRYAWWHRALTAPDQLRQRVALALSEIFVVSDRVEELAADPVALTRYNDLLLRNAFGNFRDLLREVTYSPAMGLYLSHVNNQRADPVAGTFPDENYARELMQLFTIGLFELAPDGTRRLDASGAPVPTYGNEEIRGLARVFTGLTFDCAGEEDPRTFIGRAEPCFDRPMTVVEEAHEPGKKTLVSNVTLPAGQSTREDIAGALDVLFAHPNLGPFVARRLIQRLVTSNPSPAYVARVAMAFAGDAQTPRGDMKALVRAVLTDREALAPPDPAGRSGKLRAPLLRYAALGRQFDARIVGGFFAITGAMAEVQLRQHPLSAPSVFNFYLPDHAPAGLVSDQGLVAPEFQITTASTIVNVTNLMLAGVLDGGVLDTETPFGAVRLDFTDWIALADDDQALLDEIDLVFTAGTMTANTRAAIEEAIAPVDHPEDRALLALYLTLISPDHAVRI